MFFECYLREMEKAEFGSQIINNNKNISQCSQKALLVARLQRSNIISYQLHRPNQVLTTLQYNTMTDGGNWKDLVKAAAEEGGGNVAMVNYHLDHRVDPNYQHPEYMTTPLHEAIRVGNLDVAKILLQKGAKPTIEEVISGSTPLEVAMEYKQHDIVDLLLEVLPEGSRNECKTILLTGTAYKDSELVKYLLDLGHRLVLGIDASNEKNVSSNVEALKKETGNKKIFYLTTNNLKAYLKGSKLSVGAWIHKVTMGKEESLLKNILVNYDASGLAEQKQHDFKVLLMVESSQCNKENMDQLSWLLASSKQEISAVLEPTSLWSKMTLGVGNWHRDWCINVARLLDLDGSDEATLAHKLYSYKRETMDLPTPMTQETWEKEFHSILV